MKLEPTAEENIAQTAFCWKVYGQYGSEEKAIKAFRRRKGMKEFPPEEVKLWLEQALAVKSKLDEIKKEIVRGYGRPSLEYLRKDEFEDGTKNLRSQLNSEFSSMSITVEYMISMAWCMYYLR